MAPRGAHACGIHAPARWPPKPPKPPGALRASRPLPPGHGPCHPRCYSNGSIVLIEDAILGLYTVRGQGSRGRLPNFAIPMPIRHLHPHRLPCPQPRRSAPHRARRACRFLAKGKWESPSPIGR
jgi:hypothetical protein